MNYDIRFKTPFSLILSGASGSGKTTWLEHFLSIFDKITDGKGKYGKLLWLSGTNQPDLFKRIKSNFKGTTRVFDSIDNEIYSTIEKEGKNSIIVVDDLMHEMSSNADIEKLFTYPPKDHVTRVMKYRDHVGKLNCDMLEFPAKHTSSKISQFEDVNNVSINIYKYDLKYKAVPLRISEKQNRDRVVIIVVDDLMHEMSSNADIGKLFTKGRSHLNCNVILLW